MTQTTVAPKIFDITHELASLDEQAALRLVLQNKNLPNVSTNTLEKEQQKLDTIENRATPFTKQIIEHMFNLHTQFNDMLAQKLADGKVTQEGYARFLIQAWYNARYAPEFQAVFGKKLAEFIQSHSDKT